MRVLLHGRPGSPGRPLLAATLLAAVVAGCGAGPAGDTRRVETVTVEIGDGAVESGDRSGGRTPAPDAGSPPQVPGDESCEGAREPTTEANEREAEIAVRCLTNAVRREKGLDALRFDERLARAAATRSTDMAEANVFSHTGPRGSDARSAVGGTGWIPKRKSWLLGENIGWAPRGRATPAELMRSWLDSPTHRSNILAKHFTETGVGAVAAVPKEGAEPGATYTQLFGVVGAAARKRQTR